MGQDPGQERTTVKDEQPTPEELRRDIAQTREELGETAAALASKTDVKARAKGKVDDLKQSAADKTESIKQTAASKKESFTSDDCGASGGLSAKASGIATQAKTKAQDNPIVTAAGAAFVGGFLLGRIRSR